MFSLYPQAVRFWNMILLQITELENSIAFQATITNLPFMTPNHLNNQFKKQQKNTYEIIHNAYAQPGTTKHKH